MKLIDREPTPEMLEAARFYKEGTHTLACAWRAMYDAAPEVVQKPIGYADLMRMAKAAGLGPENVSGQLQARLEFFGRAVEREARATEQEQLKEQAAEITQLKAVIAKCHSALTQSKQWKEGVNTLTCHNHEAVELALAAIKDIEK